MVDRRVIGGRLGTASNLSGFCDPAVARCTLRGDIGLLTKGASIAGAKRDFPDWLIFFKNLWAAGNAENLVCRPHRASLFFGLLVYANMTVFSQLGASDSTEQ